MVNDSISDSDNNKEASYSGFSVVGVGVVGSCERSVPSVAVRWVVYNAFTSNVELATLSNVSRFWREIVAQCVVDAATLPVPKGDKRSVSPTQTQPPLSPSTTFTRLLLPSWIRYFYASHSNFVSLRQPGEEKKHKEDEDDNETYCVAWFHPDGMRVKQITTLENNPSPEISTKSNSRPNQTSAASKLPLSSPARDNSTMNLGASSVLYQWDGYSEAIDVLSPFGYSRSLLRSILEKTQSKCSSGGSSDSKTAAIGDTNHHREVVGKSPTLSAVRGAIYARPEGYYQCWDNKNDADLLDRKDETWMAKRRLRKGELERLVLPKVMWRKHGDEDNIIEPGGILPPFIQFLNIDSIHAVRLLTPKFEKPIFTPLTVFCVAIATEDGCFFSGLREKFEMGHMHPTLCDTEINDERSPICLNAEYNERGICLSQDEFEQASVSSEFQHNNSDHMVDSNLDSHCECFNSLNKNCSDNDSLHDDSDTESCANAVRGQLGPGTWHCYVAIFDGDQSIIRIDGEEESTTCVSKIPSSFQAFLDGITIGSDHSFDMSLCFGQGSDGEGEGGMSELAFFKGRLHANDIVSLESHLMTKHGIVPTEPRKERINDDYYSRLAHKLMDESPSSSANRNKDCGNKDIPVPLRYMTELRQVAWQQRNKVTGRRLSIKRIGDKFRKDSMSEW